MTLAWRLRAPLAGLCYFVPVFAAGWVLGPTRQLLLLPWLGATGAVVLEAPFMLAAMVGSARWMLRRAVPPLASAERVGAGMTALGLLVCGELAGQVWLRGGSVGGWLAGLTTPPGAIGLALFACFAVLPWWLGQRARERQGTE